MNGAYIFISLWRYGFSAAEALVLDILHPITNDFTPFGIGYKTCLPRFPASVFGLVGSEAKLETLQSLSRSLRTVFFMYEC